MSSLPPPRLYDPLRDNYLLPQLAQIQADCILHDAQLATFLPPLDMKAMTMFWRQSAESAGVTPRLERPRGCEIVLQMAPASAGDEQGEGADGGVEMKGDGVGDRKGDVVAGYVMLSTSWSQTGPFRGEVLKLMVSPRFRRMGVARRVMEMLEDVARERGRGLLVCFVLCFLSFTFCLCLGEEADVCVVAQMLDTKVGSDAEKVYSKLGWKEVGVIPKYGIDPLTGQLVDERFFYKDLREL